MLKILESRLWQSLRKMLMVANCRLRLYRIQGLKLVGGIDADLQRWIAALSSRGRSLTGLNAAAEHRSERDRSEDQPYQVVIVDEVPACPVPQDVVERLSEVDAVAGTLEAVDALTTGSEPAVIAGWATKPGGLLLRMKEGGSDEDDELRVFDSDTPTELICRVASRKKEFVRDPKAVTIAIATYLWARSMGYRSPNAVRLAAAAVGLHRWGQPVTPNWSGSPRAWTIKTSRPRPSIRLRHQNLRRTQPSKTA